MKVSKKLKTDCKPKSLVNLKKKKLIQDTAPVLKKKVKKLAAEEPIKVKKLKQTSDEAKTKLKKVKKLNKLNVEKPQKSSSKQKKQKQKKSAHSKDLEGLKDIDPEFYDFLKKNDKKLLEFNLLDSEESDVDENEDEDVPVKSEKNKKEKKKSQIDVKKNKDDNDDDDNEEDDDDDEDSASEADDAETDEKFHDISNVQLEVASDESDFEDKDDDDEDAQTADGVQKITLNLLRQWQIQLEKPNVPIDVVRKVIQAFNSALASISGDETTANQAVYKVVGAATFNGVVQLCVLHLQPAILRVLGLNARSTTPLHKTKKWNRVRTCLRYYFMDLIRLIEHVSSPNILSVLLKHLHQMSGMIASFSSIGKTILKRLIVLWATDDETVRVLAFLCILKITRNQQVSMLNHVLKAMYLSYVRNSKFVSPNTLPAINFMRRSLVEMFALDLTVSYQHAFLYIRQLAIHLRNAVILKKKDSFQSVYNWQYINSIRLWVDLLATTTPTKPQLQPLIYPLVTIITGVIKLIPTAQYFPLRFHCVKTLITLAKETNIFIPVMPFILEVLKSNTFQRKHTNVSMKPMQFTCILRLNKSQMAENGFRDEVIEQVCALSLEYLTHESSSFAFTDLVVPVVVALKQYLKECKNSNYSRKIKQLLDKIQENARMIENERRKVTFGLKDLAQVQAWETLVRNKGTTLAVYYNSWVKMHEMKKRRQAMNTSDINDYDLPTVNRKNAGSSGVQVKNEQGEIELFPSDSEDDNDLHITKSMDEDENDNKADANEEKQPKKKKSNKQKKQKSAKQTPSAENVEVDIPLEEDTAEDVDIVKDLDLNDW